MQETSMHEEKKSILLTKILKIQIKNEKNWSKKSLYEASTKQWRWVRENYNHKKHEKINWKKYTDK